VTTTTVTRTVRVVLPGDVDDPGAPSGGNTYDRQLCRELTAAGWSVRELPVPGSWPQPGPAARTELATVLAAVPDGGLVLLDGLVACGVPEIVVPETARLRVVVLVHLPLGDETGLTPQVAADLDARERLTLRAAVAVVATSSSAAQRLIGHHGLDAGRVHAAAPGVFAAPAAVATDGGTRLLCVAAVTPRKGQDVLVEALSTMTDLDWRCDLVGALDRSPAYVEGLRRMITTHGLGDRVRLAGPRTGDELESAYAVADLLVLASHAETYGMVVTEALARGIPVLATRAGGVAEALGRAPDGALPGMLVSPGDPAALAGALRRWLVDPQFRRSLRACALVRRTTLHGWAVTARSVADVLERAHALERLGR
jgi:glycosyltransferase involved in cell wall biosynthesis